MGNEVASKFKKDDDLPKIRALRTGKEGFAVMTTAPLPSVGDNEAAIKILRAGICSTDLEILKGYMGYEGTLGHEFIGEVVSLGKKVDDSNEVKVGSRVVGEINLPCGKCEACREGGFYKRNHCPKRSVLGILNKDGTFGEAITLPVANLYAVPDNLESRVAVFAEPLAAAYRIVEQVTFTASDRIAVIGDGKLGLLCAEVLALSPHSEISMFGHNHHKMTLLPNKIKKFLVTDKSPERSWEDSYDYVVEASGSPSGIVLATKICKSLGTILLKTTCAAGTREFNTAPIVIKELKVLGSRCGNFKMALECLSEGKIDVSKYLTKEYPFDEAIEALKHAGKRESLKIQLVMDYK